MVLLAAACGQKPSAPAHPSGPQASGPRPQDQNQNQNQNPRETSQVSGRDCDKLITHAVDLGIAERPDDQKPAAEERTNMQTQLRTTWEPKCKAMTAQAYECVLTAPTLAALDSCGR